MPSPGPGHTQARRLASRSCPLQGRNTRVLGQSLYGRRLDATGPEVHLR